MSAGIKNKQVIKFLALLIIVGGISICLLKTGFFAQILEHIRSHSLAPLIFILTYSVAGFVLIPSTILKVAAGSIFGFGPGFLLTMIGSFLGMVIGFFLARVMGADFVQDYLIGQRYQALQRALKEKGELFVLILRIVPGVPFNVINILSGLLRLRFWLYLLASILGVLPSVLVFTYFSGAITESLLFQKSFLYLFISLIALSTYLILSRTLKKHLSLPELENNS